MKDRLYPNPKQRKSFAAKLEVCRDLYHDAFEERREACVKCEPWLAR